MSYFQILLPLAMILVFSKLLCRVCDKIKLPKVVGMLLAGILVGLINYIPNQTILTPFTKEGLSFFAKIGVIFIMFSAGLGTDLKTVKSTGVASIIITMLGVIVPLALGFVVAGLFNGGLVGMTKTQVMSNLFYGVVLTATSVSVTVASLKELGKLNGKAGTAIVTAAILDDIIGVILLSFIIGLSGGAESPWKVLLKTLFFFVVAIPAGIGFRYLFKLIHKKFPSKSLIAVLGISLAFVYAYLAERFCGVADITGAYFAGLMLSGMDLTYDVDHTCDHLNLFFLPVFFANIGVSTSFSGMDGNMILFGVCYIFAGLIGKVIGCGGGALICKFNIKDSLAIGVGMMVRAEVLLICAQKGIDNKMISPKIMPFVVMIIIISSFLTPVLLKLLFTERKNKGNSTPGEELPDISTKTESAPLTSDLPN